MNRLEPLVLALFSILVFAWASAVRGADAIRGNTLYHSTYKCTDCHSSSPGPGNIVATGATVDGLLGAIQTVAPMRSRFLQTLGQRPADLADVAAYLASVTSIVPAVVAAIEYYHADFDHYFVTSIADEIAKLDNGVFAGWVRTVLQFNTYATATAGTSTVCRFFSTSFVPKSSHFYTPSASECALVKNNADWQYEGDVFHVVIAAVDGTCPAGTTAVYRLYNNGQGGAPNHRYTIDAAVRDQMVARGWVIEGNGPGFAFMCAPA